MQSVYGNYEVILCTNKYSGKTIERPMNLKEYNTEIDGKEIKYKCVNSAGIAICSPISVF
jgi:hypothetical protein